MRDVEDDVDVDLDVDFDREDVDDPAPSDDRGLLAKSVDEAVSSGGKGTVEGDSAATESATTADGREAGGIAKYGTPVRYVRIVESE